MRILHVLDHSLPVHSGYSFRSQSILLAQRARGWDVAAVTSPKHEADFGPEAPPHEVIGGVAYYRTGATPVSRIPFVGERALPQSISWIAPGINRPGRRQQISLADLLFFWVRARGRGPRRGARELRGRTRP